MTKSYEEKRKQILFSSNSRFSRSLLQRQAQNVRIKRINFFSGSKKVTRLSAPWLHGVMVESFCLRKAAPLILKIFYFDSFFSARSRCASISASFRKGAFSSGSAESHWARRMSEISSWSQAGFRCAQSSRRSKM